MLDEATPATFHQYSQKHTRVWSAKIAEFDGYVFVTPEYNHSVSGSLKNAIDYLYTEWNNKAAGFVSYGSAGGARAVEQLRGIASELQLAHVHEQVMFSLFADFEDYSEFKPTNQAASKLEPMLDQLILWSRAMESARTELAQKS